MKRDQIVRLRGFVEATAGGWETVLRLIDERDALLRAAQGAQQILRQRGDTREAVNGLVAAIARAEEP